MRVLIILVSMLGTSLWATPTFDSASVVSLTSGSATAFTWTHTASASANAIFVMVGWRETDGSNRPTAVTYNGNAMTNVQYADSSLWGADGSALYSYYGSIQTSADVVVTLAGSSAMMNTAAWASTFVSAGAVGNTYNTTRACIAAIDLTMTASTTSLVMAYACSQNNGPFTPAAGETIAVAFGPFGGHNQSIDGTYKSVTNSPVTMGRGFPGANCQSLAMFEIQEIPSPTPTPTNNMLSPYILQNSTNTRMLLRSCCGRQ